MVKKILAVLLAALMLITTASVSFAADASDSFGAYKHVYIIGIDGSGAAWSDVNTPNFDRIFGENAYRYDAKTEDITISAQNWGSILCGVAHDVHGFTNGACEENERSSDSANNSIFYYVRKAMPDAQLVSFNHWSAINTGIIENDLNVKKVNKGTDDLLVYSICNYFTDGNDPTLMFVQLDEVDGAGHSFGGGTSFYYNALKKADTRLGKIYDVIIDAGKMDDALFILVADHGEAIGGSHGGHTKEESSAILAVAGKTVNNVTLPEGTRNRDVAAIALYALGIEQPSHMTAVVPDGLFAEEKEEEYSSNTNPLLYNLRLFFSVIRGIFTRLFSFISGKEC